MPISFGVLAAQVPDLGSQVHEVTCDPGTRDAVDRAVVDLGDACNQAPFETLDHVDLPQRLVLLERMTHEVGCELRELVLATR